LLDLVIESFAFPVEQLTLLAQFVGLARDFSVLTGELLLEALAGLREERGRE
jgi:hypothetical protein